jgi:adenine-specific DNA-methyltransferase
VYNSGLFGKESKTIHISDQVDISNETLSEVIQGLYSPEGANYSYNFAVLDADVLGKIYEQYLGNILKQTPKRAKLEESKTHRKEQGIYYTPSYIVDYIVKNTVGEFIRTHSPEEIRKVRILDPACGSGSFLISAYKELQNYWVKYNEKNKNISESVRTLKQTKFNPDMEGKEIEFYTTKTEILKNNIFGVDLDSKAVEIAQLNLLLQISERKHRLPLLQNNIKVGNSLIDDPSVSERAFKWEDEFPEIMKEGGFDIVIGNPPYVRIQNLNKQEVEYFNKNYYSPEKNYDIYILFIERGFKQLKQRGELGFILPHKFFEGENGAKIRQFISDSKSMNRIVNFNTNQIFEGATTYTCLLFLSKSPQKKFYYKEFKLGENFKILDDLSFEKRDVESLSAEPWNFSPKQASKILSKIRTSGISFSHITRKIFKGSSTGNDDVFLLDNVHVGENTTVVYSAFFKQEVEIENDLLKQFLYGEDIRRYQGPVSHKMLLFPYYKSQGKVVLIPARLMQSKYPKTFKYLNDAKKELLRRKVKVTENEFYKYSAGRSLSEYEQPKIMIPDMLVKNRVGYDEKGIYYHGPAIHSVLFNESVKDVDPLLYLAILNSKIFWFFITQTSTALRGDTYRLTPEFLRPFSFPKLDLTDLKIDQKYQEVIRMVKEIILLNSKLLQIQDKRTDEYNKIENQIAKIDDEIDDRIYSLYGLTESEISLIETQVS